MCTEIILDIECVSINIVLYVYGDQKAHCRIRLSNSFDIVKFAFKTIMGHFCATVYD